MFSAIDLAMLWTTPWNWKLMMFAMLALNLPPPINIIMTALTLVLHQFLYDPRIDRGTVILTLLLGCGVAWLWSALLDRNFRRKEERKAVTG